MENIIKKAIEGGYVYPNVSKTTDKFMKTDSMNPLFFSVLNNL